MTTVNNTGVSGHNLPSGDQLDAFAAKALVASKKFTSSPLMFINVEQTSAKQEAESYQLSGQPLLSELMQMSPEARKKVLASLVNLEAAAPNDAQSLVEDLADVAPVKFEKSSESIQHFIDVEKLFANTDGVDNQMFGRQLQDLFSNLLPEHSGEVASLDRMSFATNTADFGNLSDAILPVVPQYAKNPVPNVQSLGQPLLDAVVNMSPDKRKEVVSMLDDLASASKGTEVSKLLDEKLPEVKNEASGKYSIDALFELLYALLRKLGEAATARNVNGAKMAEIALKQAQASGNNLVGSAQSTFSGALLSAGLSMGIAASGFGLTNKGSNRQIGNLKSNGANGLDHGQSAGGLHTAMNNNKTVLGKEPPSLPKLDNDFVPGGAGLEVSQRTVTGVGNQSQLMHGAQNTDQLQHVMYQQSGFAVSSMAMPIGQVAASGFNIHGAEQQASAKVNDSHQEVASSMQRSEEQGGQHVIDMIAKLFALIIQSGQEANQNVGELSLAIKKA